MNEVQQRLRVHLPVRYCPLGWLLNVELTSYKVKGSSAGKKMKLKNNLKKHCDKQGFLGRV